MSDEHAFKPREPLLGESNEVLQRKLIEHKHLTHYDLLHDDWLLVKDFVQSKLPPWWHTVLGVTITLYITWLTMFFSEGHNTPTENFEYDVLKSYWQLILAIMFTFILVTALFTKKSNKSDGKNTWDRIEEHFKREMLIRRKN